MPPLPETPIMSNPLTLNRRAFLQTGTGGLALGSLLGLGLDLRAAQAEVRGLKIANAREVKIRLKGSTAVIEREMNGTSRHYFKKFLVKYFSPENLTPSRSAESKQAATKSESGS